jgi:hypothetical protein
LGKIVVKDFAPKSVLAMVFATMENARACQDGVVLRVMLANAQQTTLRWYVRVMAIVKMVNVNATIVLSDQIARPMPVQWVAFMVPVPKKANVCATMVLEVPIVPYQGALDTAMATVCAVVPSVFAARALPAMIAVRCLAVMKRI